MPTFVVTKIPQPEQGLSAFDNPAILSGKPAHGVVALFWKNSINDFVTTLEETDSNGIVGIPFNLAKMTHNSFIKSSNECV